MKGVTFIRIKLHPIAECQHLGCGWTFEGRSYVRPQTVRSNAEHHVLLTGHIVYVTVRDVAEYSPDAPADDPPEYAPDDGEAQRIAETYADAAAELARDEAGEAGRG